MELEKQVCSRELAKRLKELGFKQESLFYWAQGLTIYPNAPFANSKWRNGGKTPLYGYSAFTVAELGEILPLEINGTYYFTTHRCSRGGY